MNKSLLVPLRCALQLHRLMAGSLFLSVFGLLFGCTTVAVQPGPPLDSGVQWVLMPIANYSESPQAGKRMEAILATLLRVRGVRHLALSPPPETTGSIPVLDEQERYEHSLRWARGQDLRYGITGSIQEWRYKSGVEREPAVGLSLRVLDIATGEVLWSASGARSGWGREPISGTAQKLLSEILAAIEFGAAGQTNRGEL